MNISGAEFYESTTRWGLLRLEVQIRDRAIGLRLLPLQRHVEWIPVSEMADVHVTNYRASTYAGWHWGKHIAPQGNKVYRLRGNEGVEVKLVTGHRIFVGSQRAPEIYRALTQP